MEISQGPPIPEDPKRSIQVLTFTEASTDQSLMEALDKGSKSAFAEYGKQNTAESYSGAILEGKGTVTIVRDEDRNVVGAGIIRYHDEGSWGKGTQASQEISHAFVVPEHQNQGHGTALTRERIRQCVARGGNIWSVLMRGKKQLEMYRLIIQEEASKAGKSMHDWTGDPTTESYAYAYIEG